MQLRRLGPIGMFEADREQPLGGPKQRLVVAHLVIRANQAVRAADEAVRAGREARVATARELAAAADANLDVDPERSMVLAIEAIEATRDSDGTVLREAEEALHHAVGASRIVLRVPDVGGALDWSADGVFVTEGPEDTGVIDIRDATTGESVRRWRGHDISDVEFSDDGTLLATTGDGALRVWDTASGDTVAETVDAGVEVWSPSFSADGSLVAIESDDGRWVKVFAVAKDRVITTVTFEQPLAVAISPDGSKLAVGTEATPDISVIDAASGDELRVLKGGRKAPGPSHGAPTAAGSPAPTTTGRHGSGTLAPVRWSPPCTAMSTVSATSRGRVTRPIS